MTYHEDIKAALNADPYVAARQHYEEVTAKLWKAKGEYYESLVAEEEWPPHLLDAYLDALDAYILTPALHVQDLAEKWNVVEGELLDAGAGNRFNKREWVWLAALKADALALAGERDSAHVDRDHIKTPAEGDDAPAGRREQKFSTADLLDLQDRINGVQSVLSMLERAMGGFLIEITDRRSVTGFCATLDSQVDELEAIASELARRDRDGDNGDAKAA